ncbi:MAG: 4-(cytidine 5'-diphospho)-2-C-methyl-D-erythritol kinase [Brevinematia bacterium]
MKFNFFTSAKINLGLTVIGKLPDGYHEIESILVPVSIFDKVSIEFFLDRFYKEIGVNSDNYIQIPRDERNIIWKIVKYVEDYLRMSIGFHAYIEKNIPVGSGLGGGSGNGAGVFLSLLKFLKDNQVIDTFLEEELVKNVYKVGSDIPFFLSRGACIVQGRGEKVFYIEGLFEKLMNYKVLIVYPQIDVSTREAYTLISQRRLYDPNKWAFDFSKKFLSSEIDLSDFKKMLKNTFECVILSEVIDEIKRYLYFEGAMVSLVSGSGSAVYGIFEDVDLSKIKVGLVKNFGINDKFIFEASFVKEPVVFF